MASNSEPVPDQSLQQDILSGRTFSLADAIGREGSGFLKGESTVPRLVQAKTEVVVFIRTHLIDLSGALQAVLQDAIQADDARMSTHINSPLLALRDLIQEVLKYPERFYDFVHQVDVRWGRMYGERPYFQKPGQPPHPEDEYSHESVRHRLEHLLEILEP
jgi:hypothetical protein